MATVVYTSAARQDALAILEMLATNAGAQTARDFARSFEDLYDRLASYPEAYTLRANLGPGIRVGIVSPYLVMHRHDKTADTVTSLRVLDGRRQISSDFMRMR